MSVAPYFPLAIKPISESISSTEPGRYEDILGVPEHHTDLKCGVPVSAEFPISSTTGLSNIVH